MNKSSPAKPKVLLVITKADIGGAQIHVLQILRELSDQYQFILATGSEDFLCGQARSLGIQVELIPTLVRPVQPIRDIAASRALVRLIRAVSPELVHAHSFKAGVVARIAALATRTPCLFTAHGWAFTPGAPVGQRLIGLVVESILCRLCAGVVTICRHDLELAKRWKVGPANRRHLIRNAADPMSIQGNPERGLASLLTIGRLTLVKNQKLMLSAVSLLPETVTLTLIGEGTERQALLEAISQLGLQSRVVLAGEVADTREYLSESTIFILSSDFEGLPISVLEAMSAGLPVVSTDVGGVAEAVVDGESGYLVGRGNYRLLAEKIRLLINDPALRQRMGSRGRTHFQQHFTTARFIAEMQVLYQRLL